MESDGTLIRRFADERDERAFTQLVERHAALVAGVCARMLRQRQDAEDAFQATFLVLARRASALRKEGSLAGWLHAVAVRVCLKERTAGRRRQRRVQEAAEVARTTNNAEHMRELSLVIDEELARLPAQVRQVVVLCDLEGRARSEVAELLSIPLGTVSSRLARGREQMRKRLARGGFTVAAGGAALLLAECSQAAPAVSPELIGTTVRSADAFAWGAAAAKTTISLRVLTLAEGVLHAMLIAKWKTVVCVALLMGVSLFGGFGNFGARNTASAGTNFKDVFSDGSISDGTPVTWTPILEGWPGTQYDVVDGNLRVFGANPGDLALLAALDYVERDMSIRARVRLDSNVNEGVGIFVRGTGNAPSASLEIDAHGDVWSDQENGEYEFVVNTDLRPATDDVIIQVDAIGNKFSYWAWRAGDPMPTSPLFTRTTNVSTQAGVPGVYYGHDANNLPESSGAAVFRYVQVADTHIVPEPSGGSLCAIGGSLLSLGLLFQRRRYRL